MKMKPLYMFLCFFLLTTILQAKDKNESLSQRQPMSFTENKGQFADQNYNPRPDILFGGSDGQLTFHITNSGISYQQYRVDAYRETEDAKTKEKRKEIAQQTIYRTDIKWVNANAAPLVITNEELPGYNNYYLQQCPNGALNVKSYKGLTLQNIYNNIDLHYYENAGQLKCDYVVAPHGDYKQIQLKVEGATVRLQNDGSLMIETPLGKIQEQAPLVYQNGKRMEAHYKIENNKISFEVENYDNNYELIIDPVTRLWGTYYGGADDDLGGSVCADASGNVFVAGHSRTNSGTSIATTGSYQNTFGGGLFDAFLVKFNSAGVRSWGTYYGGTGSDFATACIIDGSGNLFMSGYTSSTSGSVMTTAGSHQGTYGGGPYDAYIAQFNSSGVRTWGTYYGGAGTDVGNSCSIDASGNIYLAGYTDGATGTVIATAGSHQNTYGGGTWDAFLVKFSSSGVRTWGTYYGGSGADAAYSCATDATGNIYMAGQASTSGGTVIATLGSHQAALGGGDDGFLAKFNSSGSRQWATFYGGAANEHVSSCATDAAGNVFIAGHTASVGGTVIATSGSHQSTSGGGWDAFVAKFSGSGARSWGTYYGDTGLDVCWWCSTDGSGNVYLVGYAGNSTGASIATPGSHQTTFGGGTYDTYLVKFSNNGVRVWGTYYGGAGDDSGGSSAVDGSGNVYLVGITDSNTGTVIATAGSHQTVNAGLNDVFLVKFADCNLFTAGVNGPVCAGGTLSLTVNNSGNVSPGYNWSGPNSFSSSVQNPTIGGLSTVNLGFYTLTLNYGVCAETSTVQVDVLNPQPTITVNSGTICTGSKFVIVASGANSYTITGGTFTVSPANTTTYAVTGTSSAGCVSGAAVSQVSVSTCVGLNEINASGITPFVKIYPNPSAGRLTIESGEGASVKIIDVRGRSMGTFSINTGVNSVSVDQLEEGVYFLEVSHSNGKQVFRIVKQ
jgi:hypothetical protein